MGARRRPEDRQRPAVGEKEMEGPNQHGLLADRSSQPYSSETSASCNLLSARQAATPLSSPRTGGESDQSSERGKGNRSALGQPSPPSSQTCTLVPYGNKLPGGHE